MTEKKNKKKLLVIIISIFSTIIIALSIFGITTYVRYKNDYNLILKYTNEVEHKDDLILEPDWSYDIKNFDKIGTDTHVDGTTPNEIKCTIYKYDLCLYNKEGNLIDVQHNKVIHTYDAKKALAKRNIYYKNSYRI